MERDRGIVPDVFRKTIFDKVFVYKGMVMESIPILLKVGGMKVSA